MLYATDGYMGLFMALYGYEGLFRRIFVYNIYLIIMSASGFDRTTKVFLCDAGLKTQYFSRNV